MIDRHECPAPGCRAQIDNRLFCCHTDWFRLSQPVRNAISQTARLPLLAPRRRAAIAAAIHDWEGR